jgi:hypothetical protein
MYKGVSIAIGVVVALVVVIGLFAFHGYSTPSDMVAIRVGAGPFEAKKVKGDCIQPSTRGYLTNDNYEYFPTSEREWDATGQKGSDDGRFTSVTKDNVEMYIPVTVRFTLITECKRLKDFYTKYARRYGVQFKNGDGTFDDTGAGYNQAWLTVLRKLVADPADTTLDRIIQDYNWRAVWNDPTTKPEIERRLTEALKSKDSLMVQTAHQAYFDNISVLVGKAQPVRKALSNAVAEEQTNVAKAQSAEAQAKADQAKAEAQIKVSQAEAGKRRAEIAGFGSVEAYNINQCIETPNCNPYPSPIIPGFSAPTGGK